MKAPYIYPFVLVTILSVGSHSCGNNSQKEAVISGKWLFKEIIYTADNRSYQNMNERQRERKKEKDEREGRGTTFLFNEDMTFVVTPGSQRDEDPITGSYQFKEGKLYIKKTDSRKEESSEVTFVNGDTMEMEDTRTGMIIVLTRIK
ncbi:MAG: hypothetical protein ACT4OJ_16535 [Bacteroidota bacterium]